MSKTVYSLVLPVTVLVVAGAGLMRLVTRTGSTTMEGPDRTITLTVEDAQFVRDGTTNPDLELETGESVRLVFRNTDHGVRHTFSVPSQTDTVYEVEGGKQISMTVRFDRPGTYRYTCPTHAPFMSGDIHVRERGAK